MQNEDKWVQTISEINKKGFLQPDEKSKNSASYVPITIGCEIFNKIGKKYFKGKLLDLGCGNVPCHNWYKDSIEEDICMDWADSLHKNEFLDVVHDISKDFPFENESFDSILSSAVLEHIFDPIHMFKECYRILKKDGYLIVSSNFSYWEHEAPHDYLRHTQFFFKKIAQDFNFEIIELHPVGDGLCVLADVSAKIARNYPKSFIFKILANFLKIIFNYYHIKNKKTILSQQPLGYFCVMKKI